jgi:phosphoribosylformylglycinamidine synthase
MKNNNPKIAIIQFPGTNCEYETKRAVEAAEMNGEFFRWNDDYKKLDKYDGYIIPGGFSYEDRSRSGVVASLDPIMKIIKKESEKNKPVLGICNGAQILIESGLIPGLENYQLGGALAVNKRVKDEKILGTGFYNTWIRIKSEVKAFTSELSMIKMPIAHGEGRFVFPKEILKQLVKNKQIVFKYCDAKGIVKSEFPTNPNGSTENIAGVCNTNGNVIAMMPHPERCEAGLEIFKAMKKFIETSPLTRGVGGVASENNQTTKIHPPYTPNNSIEIFVELIITDNEAITVENTLKQLVNKKIKIKKWGHWEIELENLKEKDWKKKIEQIIYSSELLNTNKEIPHIKLDTKRYSFSAEGLKSNEENISQNLNSNKYLIRYKDDFLGQSKLAALKKMDIKGVKKIKKGVVWKIDSKTGDLNKILKTNIFYNPFSQDCYAM